MFSCGWKLNARMRERETERTGNTDEILISFAAHMHIRPEENDDVGLCTRC